MPNNAEVPPDNDSIHNVAQRIKAVMSSATEAELGALFINAREAVHIRNILEDMAHPMRFHWLRFRMAQKQFRFHWKPGTTNLAHYWTKHYSGVHHNNFRREILTPVHKV